MSSEVLSDMLESLRGKNHRLNSIVIIRNGYVALESYMHPTEPHFIHQFYSCTKTVSSALIEIANTYWKSRNGLTIGYSDLPIRPLDIARYLFKPKC